MSETKGQVKILIIRFSSFGDIVQCLSILKVLKSTFHNSQIHFATKDQFHELVNANPDVDHVHGLKGKSDFKDLQEFTKNLKDESFDYIYDAHNNLRSFYMRMVLGPGKVLKRSKNRLARFLLFFCGIDIFPKPFKGMYSYIKPLKKWGVTKEHYSPLENLAQNWNFNSEVISKCQSFLDTPLEKTICLAPSAAWEMKRWPVQYFKILINILHKENFVVIGGPTDHFCEELKEVAPERVVNLSGKLSLLESSYIISKSKILVSADSGSLHVADLFNHPAIALLGPTAFGRPSFPNVRVLEKDLPCRPCSKDGRGKCSRETYQECMVNITPDQVAKAINSIP
jgi:ADP-heptose:LPS heptosyltransferase